MIHTLFIPRWHPTPLNKLLGNRWQSHRLKKADREMVHWYCHITKIPHADGKRRVGLTIVLRPGQRAFDPDAPWKSCCDALVQAGMLIDDNRQHVELLQVHFERSPEWGTRIMLEDIG